MEKLLSNLGQKAPELLLMALAGWAVLGYIRERDAAERELFNHALEVIERNTEEWAKAARN